MTVPAQHNVPFATCLEQLRLAHEFELQVLQHEVCSAELRLTMAASAAPRSVTPVPTTRDHPRTPPQHPGDAEMPEEVDDGGLEMSCLSSASAGIQIQGLGDADSSHDGVVPVTVLRSANTTATAQSSDSMAIPTESTKDTVVLRPEWCLPGPMGTQSVALAAESQTVSLEGYNFSLAGKIGIAEQEMERKCCRCFCPKLFLKLYRKPQSPVRMYWGFLGVFFILYDLVMLPMQVFDGISSSDTYVLDRVIQMFWVADLFMNFFEGYYVEGVLEMRPAKIAVAYLRGWFSLDLFLIIMDWVIFLATQGSAKDFRALRFLKGVRGLRSIRSLRLLRIIKLGGRFSAALSENINQEIVSIRFRISKIGFAIVLVNHFVACLWYLVGTVEWTGNVHWTDRAFDMNGISQNDWSYRYTSSLYWSLSNLGFGSTSLEPVNTVERVFAIICLFCAVITVSYLLGSMTTLMDHLQDRNREQNEQGWLFRRYCQEHCISKDLLMRAEQFLDYAFRRRTEAVDPDTIIAFKMLSEPLHAEVLYEANRPYLESHAFFRVLVQSSYLDARRTTHTDIVHQLSHKALRGLTLARSDVIFCQGDHGRETYLVDDGELSYDSSHPGCHAKLRPPNIQKVLPERWIAEASLWTHWAHRGELEAKMETQLLAIDAATFRDILFEHPVPWEMAHEYAVEFVERLNNIPNSRRNDLSMDPRHKGSCSTFASRSSGLGPLAYCCLVFAECCHGSRLRRTIVDETQRVAHEFHSWTVKE